MSRHEPSVYKGCSVISQSSSVFSDEILHQLAQGKTIGVLAALGGVVATWKDDYIAVVEPLS